MFIEQQYCRVLKTYMNLRLLGIVLILLFKSCAAHATDVVRYNVSEKYYDVKQLYYIELLELALQNSKDQYGSYTLSPVVMEMAQGRTTSMVERNKFIDVVWKMTTQRDEQKLAPVYFPLLRGLMGYRIFIIKRDNQAIFTPDINKAKLQELVAGQGYDWPDTDILKRNLFNVVTSDGPRLLDMLIKQRFDYYPRALHEPWVEIEDNDELMVEQHLLLQYFAPMYFFVNKNNERLQKRLTYGLNQALLNGQFIRFFNSHPLTQHALAKANLPSRKVFELANPFLSNESKLLLKRPELWLHQVSLSFASEP